jgi:hypothetical protein
MSANRGTPSRGKSMAKNSSLIENFEYSIFSTVEESPFAIASEESSIKGKVIKAGLVS